MTQGYLKQAGILAAGSFFCLASLWVPHVQSIAGHGIGISVDSMVLLGLTLLVALLGMYFLPDFFVSRSQPSLPRGLTVVCGLLFLIGSIFLLHEVNQKILHAFLSSADEHSCYFLAECLRKGKLFVEIPPLADFFNVVHVGMRDGKWYSVYPLGWPLIWALGLNLNMVDWLNPVMASLAILLFYFAGSKLFGRVAAALGLFVMFFNPFFIFTAASYFSHGTCFLMISIFLYAFLRWREAYENGRDPVGWAALAAFACGYGLMTRYLTMAAIAGPFLLYHFLPILFGWKANSRTGFRYLTVKRPQFRKSDLFFLTVVGIFMALILGQNYLVTGKAFKAPVKYYQSWERLGFKKGHYTVVDAFFFLVARIFFLMDWFAPAFVGLYLVLIFNLRRLTIGIPSSALKIGSGATLRNIFRLGMVFLACAYFLYYSWGGNQWGPRYLWEGMPFLCISVADWIVSSWRKGSSRVRKYLLSFVIMSLVTSGIIFVRQAATVEESSRQRRALYDLAEQTILKPAIVFIHGFLGDRLVLAEDDAVRNSPFLDGRILYAHDLGGKNALLMKHYPDRVYYRGGFDRNRKRAFLDGLSVYTAGGTPA